MTPLRYHAGHRAVQAEANTTHVADKLAGWVGPVERYATGADLVILATIAADGSPGHVAISGDPPLAGSTGPGLLGLPGAVATVVRRQGARAAGAAPGAGIAVGGLVISLARAERARVNGTLQVDEDGCTLEIAERFALCRKYISPSIPVAGGLHVGPLAWEPVALSDPWVAGLVATADTAFLASCGPDGDPDVAHRGGPAGFLSLDTDAGSLSWDEYVGDGVFKSAGNIRATGIATMLVPDFATGDAVEIAGSAVYENVLARFQPREDALVRHDERFPRQGTMVLAVRSARRLRALTIPRQRVPGETVTSRDDPEVQAPR